MTLHASTYRCLGEGVSQSETRRLPTTPTACCFARTFMNARVFSSSIPFPPANLLLLEKQLGDLCFYICARDLLMMTSDLASELQLALACFIDELVDGALGQEAADLYLALLAQAMGTVLTIFSS
jgi:hypothetical protein